MASWQFDRGGGGGTTTASMGPEEFVRAVVGAFELRRLGVDESVVTFMLSDVVIGEKRWFAGIEAGKIDLPTLQGALNDALEAASKYSEERGLLIVSRTAAEATFRDVIESQWKCPYGLWWC